MIEILFVGMLLSALYVIMLASRRLSVMIYFATMYALVPWMKTVFDPRTVAA